MIQRRDFLAASLGGTAALLLRPAGGGAVTSAASAMPERVLGSTGHRARLFSLGGRGALARPDREGDAHAILQRALDLGVNTIDTAASYGNGVSERYVGQVVKTRRHQVFLASKAHERTRDGALRLLERSLALLQTDHLDLWQLPDVQGMAELDRIFARGGAVEALQQARAEGMVRFVGITGQHDPDVLLEAIRRYDFDTIMLDDLHSPRVLDRLLPEANRRRMGVLACAGPRSLQYTLSFPVSTLVLDCESVAQVEEIAGLAASFRPFSSAELARMR